MGMTLARAARLVHDPLNFAGSLAILTSYVEDAAAWGAVSQQSMLIAGLCFTVSSASWVAELVLQQRMKCTLYRHISHRDTADRLMLLGRVLMNSQLQCIRDDY